MFCQRGSNFDVFFGFVCFLLFFFFFFFFFWGGGGVDEGREDPSITKSGSSSARQRNAINGVSLAGR